MRLSQLIKEQNITGVVVDITQMEGTGGGFYPSYLCRDGVYTQLSDDIGEAAYILLSIDIGDIDLDKMGFPNFLGLDIYFYAMDPTMGAKETGLFELGTLSK